MLDAESWELIAGRERDATRRRRSSAIRHAGAAAPDRHRARGGRRPRQAGRAWARAHRLRGAAARRRHRSLASAERHRFRRRDRRRARHACPSSRPPMPRRKRWPSPSRCARRSRRPARPRPWSRPTAGLPAACSPRSSAGTSRSTIPAATRSPIRRPAPLRGSRRRWRSAGCAPVRLLALLKHPLVRLGPRRSRARACHLRRWRRRSCAARGRGREPAGLAQALTTLNEELGKLRRGEPSDLHRSDPRTDLSEAELDAAAALIGRLSAAFAPLEAAAGRRPSPRSRHATGSWSRR